MTVKNGDNYDANDDRNYDAMNDDNDDKNGKNFKLYSKNFYWFRFQTTRIFLQWKRYKNQHGIRGDNDDDHCSIDKNENGEDDVIDKE